MEILIPQTNPLLNYQFQKAEIDQAILDVLGSGSYILGSQVEAFEQEWANYLQVEQGIGVNSGTDALVLALRACGIGLGDAVVTSAFTAVATIAAIEYCGASPILIDIDPNTYSIDMDQLTGVLANYYNRRLPSGLTLKAILPVHIYGSPAPMLEICKIARQYQLWVIEDAAQAHGAALKNTKLGAFGDISGFSFYPTKNLGAIGDGGMIVTSNTELAERARLLRQYGWRDRNNSEIAGINSRLDEIQAAILRIRLKSLDGENHRRREIAQIYSSGLGDTSLVLPVEAPNTTHVYHQYVVRTPNRDSLKSYLAERGIQTLIHYPNPIHMQPAYINRIAAPGELPQTERVSREVLSLPMFPQLSNVQIAWVCQAIHEWDASRDSIPRS